jgi:glutamate-5-semialdehyde dehydrogenase
MTAHSIAETLQTIGLQAKTASALMAKAPTAVKNTALRKLAALLRANVQALQVDNARDMERAIANGLAEPMVDRLKLTPKGDGDLAQGCEQLAAMPDVIGEIIGMKQQPSGIRVGQMRVPIGVFGMIFESRPNVTIEAASSLSRAAMPASCAAARRPLSPTRRWRGWCSRRWSTAACPPTPCNWCRRPTARPWAS